MSGITAVPGYVTGICDALRENGFEAYLVGGCVRDGVMGKEPHDYDLATNASPEEVKKALSSYRLVETGIRHGTVTAVTDGGPVEITTYRIDGEYKDNRHPESVAFTGDLKLDLMRRDFTVNAMAYDPRGGLVDLFSGREHIEKRLIVCVGDPDERFDEDGLRVLRALRFASVLDFEIEENTAASVRRKAELLRGISRERVFSEIKKMLCGQGAGRILGEFADVLTVCLVGVTEDGLRRAARVIGGTDPSPEERLALLYAASLTDEAAVIESVRGLKPSRAEMKEILSTFRVASSPLPETLPQMRRTVGREGGRATLGGVRIRGALGDGGAKAALEAAEGVLSRGDCVRVRDLKIGGDDLIREFGISGERVGQILDELLFLVTEDHVPNEKNALLGAAGKYARKG